MNNSLEGIWKENLKKKGKPFGKGNINTYTKQKKELERTIKLNYIMLWQCQH